MRTLSDAEKARIQATLAPLVEKKEVLGSAVYGSQIAGYAREDSDYDVLLAVRPFRQRIKYYYLKGEAECAALLVEAKAFSKDCTSSSLGEFVSGRLLNPYEVLQGKEFLRKNDVEFKKRVIVEGLLDACAEQEDFASELYFHLPYFLFEKLKKRAAIYPPVAYSYSMTYGEKLLRENLEYSLRGFRVAAAELAAEGYLSFDVDKDQVRITPKGFVRGGLSAKLSAAASYTSTSLRQYAVHGYAGRVGPKVVGREVVSKLSRSRKNHHLKLPEQIQYPKRGQLSLLEGRLFADSEDWMGDLMEELQVTQKETKVDQKALGEIYTTSTVYTLADGRAKLAVAVKRFNDIKGMKWGLLNLWSLKNADYVINPLTRMLREYQGLTQFRSFGLHTPAVLAVFLAQRMLVTQFIPGKDLSRLQSEYLNGETEDLVPFGQFGRALATVHNHGYCVGDSKPSNAILADKEGEIYLTDLEQSHRGGNPAWDVAEFIYFSVRFTMKEERVRKLINAFLAGYSEKTEDPSTIEKTAALRYRAPFQPFIAPNVLSGLLKDLKR